MPRSLVLTLIVAHGLAVAGVAIAAGWSHSKPRPCRATFERVREGMTLAEVEAAVGGPPGDYCSREAFEIGGFMLVRGEQVWVCDRTELRVIIGKDGTAVSVTVGKPHHWQTPTRLERFFGCLTP